MEDQDSARKGKAVEHLVAATCILTSGLKLNVSTSLVDDEGVDLVFHRREKINHLGRAGQEPHYGNEGHQPTEPLLRSHPCGHVPTTGRPISVVRSRRRQGGHLPIRVARAE